MDPLACTLQHGNSSMGTPAWTLQHGHSSIVSNNFSYLQKGREPIRSFPIRTEIGARVRCWVEMLSNQHAPERAGKRCRKFKISKNPCLPPRAAVAERAAQADAVWTSDEQVTTRRVMDCEATLNLWFFILWTCDFSYSELMIFLVSPAKLNHLSLKIKFS